jgi:hypothetical protein
MTIVQMKRIWAEWSAKAANWPRRASPSAYGLLGLIGLFGAGRALLVLFHKVMMMPNELYIGLYLFFAASLIVAVMIGNLPVSILFLFAALAFALAGWLAWLTLRVVGGMLDAAGSVIDRIGWPTFALGLFVLLMIPLWKGWI